jgi:hypothetical protein
VNGRSNSVNAYKSWNVPNRKQNQRVEDLSGVSLESAAYVDNAIYCKVVVDSVFKVEDNVYNLDDDDYFVLLAAGSSLKRTYKRPFCRFIARPETPETDGIIRRKLRMELLATNVIIKTLPIVLVCQHCV